MLRPWQEIAHYGGEGAFKGLWQGEWVRGAPVTVGLCKWGEGTPLREMGRSTGLSCLWPVLRPGVKHSGSHELIGNPAAGNPLFFQVFAGIFESGLLTRSGMHPVAETVCVLKKLRRAGAQSARKLAKES